MPCNSLRGNGHNYLSIYEVVRFLLSLSIVSEGIVKSCKCNFNYRLSDMSGGDKTARTDRSDVRVVTRKVARVVPRRRTARFVRGIAVREVRRGTDLRVRVILHVLDHGRQLTGGGATEAQSQRILCAGEGACACSSRRGRADTLAVSAVRAGVSQRSTRGIRDPSSSDLHVSRYSKTVSRVVLRIRICHPL
jgi:hypothetical protein